MDRARRARSGRVPQTDSSLRGGPKLEPVPKLGTLSQTGGPAHGRGAPDNACALQRHLLDRTEVEPNYWAMPVRSEERRVGKECRSRWSRNHEKKRR